MFKKRQSATIELFLYFILQIIKQLRVNEHHLLFPPNQVGFSVVETNTILQQTLYDRYHPIFTTI